MKIICIGGAMGSGKDTFANMLKESLEERDCVNALITHYADLLKYICTTFLGWNGEKDEYGRRLLQHVGTEVFRTKDSDYWVKFIAGILQAFPTRWDYVLIPDTRFPNEIIYLEDCGYTVLYLKMFRRVLTNEVAATGQNWAYRSATEHISEHALDNMFPDARIENTGTIEDLRKKAQILADFLLRPEENINWCKEYYEKINHFG